jgi:hypothetical protein
MHKYLYLTLAGLVMLACKDPDNNGGLPPEASGPFLPRMTKGWTLDSLTYTADLPMDIGDTTVPVRVYNKARDVSGRFDFFTRNDTDFVDYRIQFTADLLPGVAPYTYSKQTARYGFMTTPTPWSLRSIGMPKPCSSGIRNFKRPTPVWE